MVPADEFDIQKACLFRFFSQIEDDVVHRIAHILEANWKAIHLLTEDQSFSVRVSTYKRALSANPYASTDVELDRRFWRMMDDLRIVRNAFAHGSQFFEQSEAGIRHVYSRAGLALNGRYEHAVDVAAMPASMFLASHLHMVIRSIVLEDRVGPQMAFAKALSSWDDVKPYLPKGRSPRWPPRETKTRIADDEGENLA